MADSTLASLSIASRADSSLQSSGHAPDRNAIMSVLRNDLGASGSGNRLNKSTLVKQGSYRRENEQEIIQAAKELNMRIGHENNYLTITRMEEVRLGCCLYACITSTVKMFPSQVAHDHVCKIVSTMCMHVHSSIIYYVHSLIHLACLYPM